MAHGRRSNTRQILPWLLALSCALLVLPENWRLRLRAEAYGWLEPLVSFYQDETPKSAPRAALSSMQASNPDSETEPEQEELADKSNAKSGLSPAEVDRIQAESVRLRDKVQHLNQMLAALGSADDYHGAPPAGVIARVLSRDLRMQDTVLTVNQGRARGVNPGAGVLFRGAVAGRVVAASNSASCVALLTHRGARIAARLADSRAEGVLQGSDEASGERLCRMKVVARSAPARTGEAVVTSGLDNSFPPGCWIGTAVNVRKVSDLEWEILVRPACDASSVEALYVLCEKLQNTPANPAAFTAPVAPMVRGPVPRR